jgi:hypothetical protein
MEGKASRRQMKFRVLSKDDRKFFTTTYRLAQQSVEAFSLWTHLVEPLRDGVIGQQPFAETNEELLRIILTNAKRAFIVTTYILCDTDGRGAEGHNVQELIDRTAQLIPTFNKADEQKPLSSPDSKLTIKKLRILRNNLDGHHSVSEKWKQRLGTIQNSQMENLIIALYNVVVRCNAAVALERMPLAQLKLRTKTYADRLLRALAQQTKDNKLGTEFVRVEDWEGGARYDSVEEMEAWQQKQRDGRGRNRAD